MQVSSTRSVPKRNTVEMLMEIGYSKEKAENLYGKYKNWGKLDELVSYIETKQSLKRNVETIPLRDM